MPKKPPGPPTEYVGVATSGTPPGRDVEFTTFVRASSVELGRLAWFLCGDTTRAEDLVQQALLRVYLAWPRAREADTLAYARRVLINARTDLWRRHRREVLVAPADLHARGEGSAEADYAERDALVRALATLTARQRRIVVLRHLEGLPEREVAELLGVALGTVKSTASRGLRQLRVVLDTATEDATTAGDLTSSRDRKQS